MSERQERWNWKDIYNESAKIKWKRAKNIGESK